MSKKQFVVYTVQTGGYDRVQQPLVIDERFDYILFSDSDKEKEHGIWEVRQIPYSNEDLTRLSRYPKMHPHELLGDYEASLYIDANIQIIGPNIYERFIKCYKEGIEWGGIKHPYRDCIYDEAYVIYGLDTETKIFNWCHKLRTENYPRNYGLFENNIIYRLHNKSTLDVNIMWWSLYESYTRRDQLTLYYVLWKSPKLKLSFLLPSGESSWNSNTVQIHKHLNNAKQIGRRGIKESFLEHARNRCRCGLEEKKDKFREFHYWLYGLNPIISRFILFLWGVYSLLVYGFIIKYRTYKKHKKSK